MEWQPIETAPKGPLIIVHDLNLGVTAAKWNKFWECWTFPRDEDCKNNPALTHWQPLPPSPTESTPDAAGMVSVPVEVLQRAVKVLSKETWNVCALEKLAGDIAAHIPDHIADADKMVCGERNNMTPFEQATITPLEPSKVGLYGATFATSCSGPPGHAHVTKEPNFCYYEYSNASFSYATMGGMVAVPYPKEYVSAKAHVTMYMGAPLLMHPILPPLAWVDGQWKKCNPIGA